MLYTSVVYGCAVKNRICCLLLDPATIFSSSVYGLRLEIINNEQGTLFWRPCLQNSMKIRCPADSVCVRKTNAQKHEGMELWQGCLPQKESPLGLAICHCSQYQTVHWTILEAFAMVTVNTKMWKLQCRLQCYGTSTRLHGGSDGRSFRCSLHFQQKCPAVVSLITSITQESRHNATRTIRYTDGQTDRPGTPCSSCRPSGCLAACIPQFNVSQTQIPFSPQWTASKPLLLVQWASKRWQIYIFNIRGVFLPLGVI